MKSIIGITIGAGCLLALMPRLVAQDDQMVRHRTSRAQMTPSTSSASIPPPAPRTAVPPQRFRSPPLAQSRPPVSNLPPAPTPRLRRSFQRGAESGDQNARPNNALPNRSASQGPEIKAFKPGSTTGSSALRHKSKKPHSKTADHAGSPSPTVSSANQTDQNGRRGASEQHEPERTIPPTLRVPPTAPPASARTPPVAPMETPRALPPITAAPPQRPGPVAERLQRTSPQRPVLNDLSEDERARLHSAHQNALQHDPNLADSRARYLNARREFREKLRDALLKADPSVRPILDKIHRDQGDDH